MPWATNPCPTPGCPNTVTSGRCDDCQANADAQRGSAAARGYGTHWRHIRRQFLSHPDNLFCALCPSQANVADHHPISRRDLIAQGVQDPDAPHRLRPLCKPCHDGQTAQHQPGGWNA